MTYDHPFICLEELPDGLLGSTYYGETWEGVTGDRYLGSISLSPRVFGSRRRAVKVLEHEHLHWILRHIGEHEASECLDNIHGHPGWRGEIV